MTELHPNRRLPLFRMTPATIPADVPAGTEAYFSEDGRSVIAWRGKSGKAAFFYRYPNPEQASKFLESQLNSWAEAERTKAADRAAQKAAVCPWAVGDVLCGSYGYEQTNVLFWKIESMKGRRVTLRKLGRNSVSGDGWQGCVVPGEALNETAVSIAQVSFGTWYALDHGRYRLTKWDGKPQFESSYH